MSSYECIERIANEGMIERMVTDMQISGSYSGDLVQELYLILLDYESSKIVSMYESGQIRFFISRIIMNQMFSSNSPFYMKYRRFGDMTREISWDNDVEDYE